MKIRYKNQLKELQDQLKDCKKELKSEQDHAEKLVKSLSQHHAELNKRFEEIRELKSQAHKYQKDANQLNQDITYWERHSCHLQVLLDQKEAFL